MIHVYKFNFFEENYYKYRTLLKTNVRKAKIMTRKLTFNIPNFGNTFVEGTTDINNLGNLIKAGLPNISGNVTPKGGNLDGYIIRNDDSGNGALYIDSANITNKTSSLSIGSYGVGKINIDASLSSPIYGNSSTVQPNALYMTYVIKY